MKFKNIFNVSHPVIGMVHLLPLPGFKGAPSFSETIETALKDAHALQKGGVHAILIENNYDLPHTVKIGSEVVAAMTKIVSEIRREISLPLGVCALWNDFEASLAISLCAGGVFIRIPCFVDTVDTSYGIVTGNPKEVVEFRRKIGADHIALFTDIHVKHAELLSKMSLGESAKAAVHSGSDALIVTGRWTAEPPLISDLIEVRSAIGDYPVLIGSGVSEKSLGELHLHADGFIVGTAFKSGEAREGEVNVKGFGQRINSDKVSQFMKALAGC